VHHPLREGRHSRVGLFGPAGDVPDQLPAVGARPHVHQQFGAAFTTQGAGQVGDDQLFGFLATDIEFLTHDTLPILEAPGCLTTTCAPIGAKTTKEKIKNQPIFRQFTQNS